MVCYSGRETGDSWILDSTLASQPELDQAQTKRFRKFDRNSFPDLGSRKKEKEETRRYFIKGFTSDLNCLSREEWHHYFTAKNIQYCTQVCYIGEGVSHFRFSQWALVLIAVTDLSWTIPMVIDFWALLSTSLIPEDCDTPFLDRPWVKVETISKFRKTISPFFLHD